MKANKNRIPSSCPSCGGALMAVRLECSQCGTEVTGEYDMCPVCRLEGETKELFDLFIYTRGNLKQVERELGLSYPTVRLKIDTMFRKLMQDESFHDPKEILAKVRGKELSVDEAEKLLRGD